VAAIGARRPPSRIPPREHGPNAATAPQAAPRRVTLRAPRPARRHVLGADLVAVRGHAAAPAPRARIATPAPWPVLTASPRVSRRAPRAHGSCGPYGPGRIASSWRSPPLAVQAETAHERLPLPAGSRLMARHQRAPLRAAERRISRRPPRCIWPSAIVDVVPGPRRRAPPRPAFAEGLLCAQVETACAVGSDSRTERRRTRRRPSRTMSRPHGRARRHSRSDPGQSQRVRARSRHVTARRRCSCAIGLGLHVEIDARLADSCVEFQLIYSTARHQSFREVAVLPGWRPRDRAGGEGATVEKQRLVP